FLATALSLLSLILIVEDVSNDSLSSPVPSSQYIANTIRVVSYIGVAVLIYLERKYHVTTSGVLFTFWFLLIFCDVVPLYSKILQQ
ncbi:Multidrug resistance-associated protein 1, partial [Biomphalaria glabrata]